MKPEQIVNMLVTVDADLDDIEDRIEDAAVNRAKELMREPEQRDTGLWADMLDALDLDYDLMDVSGADSNAVPVSERGDQWMASVGALWAGCFGQAFAEHGLRPTIENGDDRAAAHERITEQSSQSELRAAAKVGVSKAAVQAERDRRRGALQ